MGLVALLLGALLLVGWAGGRGLRRLERAARADWGGPWLNRLDGLNRLFCRRFHRLRSQHLVLPARGPALVIANHISGLDPLLLLAVANRPLRFMIAREEYNRWYLRWLFRAVGCIPVERSRNPRAGLSAARAALRRGEVVALFPQGRIHLDHEPEARLKRGVLHLALASGAPIYPVRLDGVGGSGRVLGAVFRRSRARATVFPHLYFDSNSDGDEALAQLAALLRLTRRDVAG